MCGIVGFFSVSDAPQNETCIDEAIHLLKHRGPDDDGKWVGGRVGLGSTRLSIQDLTLNGHQPFISDDNRYVIVFNGEIYNFKTIRKELEGIGIRFKSRSDTEVVLRLFQLEGKRSFSKFNGMFALAIYDTRANKLILARDRFGIKPLYLLKDVRGVYFASEIKAFLPFVKKMDLAWDLNEDAIYEYMLFRYVSGKRTLLKNVTRCSPGCWVEIEDGGTFVEKSYYDLKNIYLEQNEHSHTRLLDEEASIDIIKDKLKDSIRLRMISDAPIGIALSGGVDSSLITALMREVHGGRIDTFSIVFKEKSHGDREIDESEYSDYIARKFETNHHKIMLDEKSFADKYLKAIWHNDEPIHFPNSMGVFLFSEVAAKNVKVLLGGEGADEVFAGYDYFTKSSTLHPLKNRLAKVKDVRKLLRGSHFSLDHRKHLLGNGLLDNVNKEIIFSIDTYLQPVENRLDKMSMAAGMEMRVPFLDHHVVETSLMLPCEMKLQRGETKYVIKRLAEQYMPLKQIYRPKVGFSTPLNLWLRKREHIGRYVSILEEERTLNRSFFKTKGVKQLLEQFKSGIDSFEYSIAGRIWILLNLELWIRTYIEEMRPLTD